MFRIIMFYSRTFEIQLNSKTFKICYPRPPAGVIQVQV